MSLDTALAQLKRIKRTSAAATVVLRILRALVLGAAAVSIWSLVSPDREVEQLALGALTLVMTFIISWRRRAEPEITRSNLILALEMKYSSRTGSTLPADATAPMPLDWMPHLRAETDELRAFEWRRNLSLASTLVLPLALSFVTLSQTAPSFKMAMNEVSKAVSRLSRGATLKIVQGATEEEGDKPRNLSANEPLKIELLAQNLVEIRVTGGGFGKAAPAVELRRDAPVDPFATSAANAGAGSGSPSLPGAGSASESASGSGVGVGVGVGVGSVGDTAALPPKNAKPQVFQSFQMTPQRDVRERRPTSKDAAADDAVATDDANGNEPEATSYTISFAVTEPVDLYIPAMSDSKPLAHIKVRQLPIPKVKLTVASQLEDPWPDDQPIVLHIQVKAENPLQTVRLLIKSGNRTSKELVANVMTEDKVELTSDYRLILEQYVESDLAEVEIVAEAIDRSLPTPLAGLSEPIKINTASAYGRYKQSLQTLRELKQFVDDATAKQEKKLPKEAADLAKKAADQSEKSPFFDGLDRVQIHRFQSRVEEFAIEPAADKLMELSATLNDFLFEHEILDDRERDRDFFVAARSLSRLLEQKHAERPVAAKVVSDRLKKFLDDRQGRWAKRVDRLPPADHPKKWPEIQKKPFQGAMDQIAKLDEASDASPKARNDQLTALSKAVVDYRAWIEELEAQEDKARDQEEKQRQEGLASARDQMRELQKRQGEVSADLDRSDQRSKSEISGQWPATRMKENANIRDTKRLEGELRSLSPAANARIQAAIQSMEQTADAGNNDNFTQAETSADLAGRLLRQAESAASQSQQKRRSRGRRRRVTGDNYYGQSVVGGDVEIKREYQVDRRYREDILDEVQNAPVDDDNRVLLDSYLREIVR